ncbi:WD40 repeat-like protein [Panus rudis PR-1116 ss-1]|nr:WD40 repeat-like protein [Panus rudis PR-1116 ss-1]
MKHPITLSADEINCLIHAYFEDSGFQHSAFVLRAEAHLDRSPHINKTVVRGHLPDLLSKALLYLEVESHWRRDTVTANCTAPFTILEPHKCVLDAALPATATYNPPMPPPDVSATHSIALSNGTTEKRKASTPIVDDHTRNKRARTEDLMEVDSASSALRPSLSIFYSFLFQTKASTPAPLVPIDVNSSVPSRASNLPQSPPEPSPVRFLKGHKTEVFVCAWNPADKSVLATGSQDTTVNLWKVPNNLTDQTELEPPVTLVSKSVDGKQGDITCLDWSPDGSLLAIGSYDEMLRVCTPLNEMYFSHEQHEGPIFSVRFSPSGKWLITASLDGSVCAWDIAQKKLHAQYNCHEACCLDVDWLSDEYFVSCGADSKIVLMKLGVATPISILTGHTSEVNQIKFSPNKKLLASCADDHTTRIWPVIEGQSGLTISYTLEVLWGHTQTVTSIAWQPPTAEGESNILATCAFDSSVRLWDVRTGECLHVFTDHTLPVYALSFSPDSRFLATGSGDGWLHVFDIKTRKKRWSWFNQSIASSIFEIDWSQTDNVNRMALALQSTDVGIVDVSRISSLQ